MEKYESANDTAATNRLVVNPDIEWVGLAAFFLLLLVPFPEALLWAERMLDGRTLADAVGCEPI